MSQMSMTEHPDIRAMQQEYDATAETPMAMTLDGLLFLAGLYCAISPWVVAFDAGTPVAASNVVVGLAVALMACALSVAFGRTHRLAWTVPVLGLWILVSPWVIRGDVDTTTVVVNNIVTGAVILLLGLAAMGMMRARASMHRAM